jgi:hypothetical protein
VRRISPEQQKSLTELGRRPISPDAQARYKLRQYLVDHDLTVNQFALTIGVKRTILDAIFRGEWRSKGGYLQLHHAFAIEWATQGAVQAYEWLEDPACIRRIMDSRMSVLKDFEYTQKRMVLQWASLKRPEAVLRHKARVLSRLFNVQWGEVKSRAKWRAALEAKKEVADVSHLLAPEMSPIDDNGVYVSSEHPELSNEEWFKKVVGT